MLICLEASQADAERMSWTPDVRLFDGYDESDPRPPGLRALDLARQIASDYDRVGLELSLGTQAADRMVGEPTTYPKAWFDAFPDAADATPLLAQRAGDQDRAGDRADAARERDRGRARWSTSRRGSGRGCARARSARCGTAGCTTTAPADHPDEARSSSRTASRSSGRARGSARSPRPAAARSRSTSRRSSRSGSAPTATGATTRRTSCPASSTPRYAELEQQLMEVYTCITSTLSAGDSLAELDREIRDGLAETGYPGQPSHPICHGVGARAHEPPYAHQAGGGTIEAGHGARDRAGRLLARGRRPSRRGQLPDHRRRRRAALPLPGRDRACAMIDRDQLWTGDLNRRALEPQPHDPSASTTRRSATASRRSASSSTRRTSSRSPARSTRPASTGSRPASRGSRRRTPRRSG